MDKGMRICKARWVKSVKEGWEIKLFPISALGIFEPVNEYVDKYNTYYRSKERLKSEQHFEFEQDFEFLIVHHSLPELIARDQQYMFAQEYYITDKPFNNTDERSEDLVALCRNPGVRRLPMIHLTWIDILKNPDGKNSTQLDEALEKQTKRYRAVIDSSIWNYCVPIEVSDERIDFTRFEGMLQAVSGNTHFVGKQVEMEKKQAETEAERAESVKRQIELEKKRAELEQQQAEPGRQRAELEKKLTELETELTELDKKRGVTNLYRLSVTREYADFRARLLRESFLLSDKQGGRGGHGTDVSPFIFHSEHFIHEKIFVEKGKLRGTYAKLKDEKWRFLLLDDRIFKEKIAHWINGEDSLCSKLDVLLKILTESGFSVGWKRFLDDQDVKIQNETADTQIVIYCVETVDEALSALKQYKFEVVLLDYLLKPRASTYADYGYEVLSKLIEPDSDENKFRDDTYKLGPHNRVYFMFMSAFTTAVADRLLAQGLHRSEPFWHIAEGACPTNTPNLFLYNLLHLMRKRITDSGLEKLSMDEIKGFVKKIFDKKVNTRQQAGVEFKEVLQLLYHYKNLLKDAHLPEKKNIFESKESVLATQYICFEKAPNMGGLLEHLVQLVYLTAFGTVRQWPEMWEEYLYVSKILGPQPEVEDYIARLKDNTLK